MILTKERFRTLYVDPNSNISDSELDEIIPLVADFFDDDKYLYNSNHFLTDDVAERDEHVTNLCCGIRSIDYTLSNGKVVYYAFDYGH